MANELPKFSGGVVPAIISMLAIAVLALAAFGGWGMAWDALGPSAPSIADAAASGVFLLPARMPATLGRDGDGPHCGQMHEATSPSQCQQMHQSMHAGEGMTDHCPHHTAGEGAAMMNGSPVGA
jgi:hypothetical protein